MENHLVPLRVTAGRNMSVLGQIFNSAQGRLQQRSCLIALSKGMKDGVCGPAHFQECLDVLLPARACAEVQHALEFASRAVFLKEGAFLGPTLKVSNLGFFTAPAAWHATP